MCLFKYGSHQLQGQLLEIDGGKCTQLFGSLLRSGVLLRRSTPGCVVPLLSSVGEIRDRFKD